MERPDLADLVCLYLDALAADAEGSPPAERRTVRGIGEGLELDVHRATERVELLRTLRDLSDEVYLADEQTRVRDGGGRRSVYSLAGAGRQRAARLRERAADETVTVTDGDTSQTVRLTETGAFFEELPLVKSLVRLTDAGEIRLGDGVTSEFVDRETELARLTDAIESVTTEGSHAVVVGGPAGIGKTTLVERALAEAPDEYAVGAAACQPAGAPFEPALSALGELPAGEELVAPVRELEALDVEDPDALAAERRARFDDVADALREASDDAPLVVFLDDLQWADGATLDLFVHVATAIDEWIYPVAFVATYRVEGTAVDDRLERAVADLVGRDRGERIDLGPLPETDSRGLVAWLTDRYDLPDGFVSALREATGGNPLYLRETVGYLLETGQVDPAAGEFPASADALAVPDDIGTVLETRVRAYPDDVRTVLETVAVVGESADPALVAAVLDRDPAAVNDALDLLAAGRLLEFDDDRVRFTGGLVRETLVERLDPDRRRRLHERVATAIPEVVPDADDHHARIASHHERAGNREQALEHYRRAAEHASDVYARDEAVEHYESALALARDLDREETTTELLLELGDVEFSRDEYDAARRRLEAVRDRTDDDHQFVKASAFLAGIANRRAEYGAALDLVEEGLERWDGDRAGTGVCRSLLARGNALERTGRVDEAADVYRRLLDVARETGDDMWTGVALHSLAVVEDSRGNYATSVEYGERAVETFERIDDRVNLGQAVTDLGVTYARRGDLAAAVDALERALALKEQVASRSEVALTQRNLAELYAKRGEFDRALDMLSTARETFAAVERPVRLIDATVTLGWVHVERGDLSAAREAFEAATDRLEDVDSRRHTAVTNLQYARWHRLADDPGEARSRAETALEVAREAGLRREAARANLQLSGALRVAGERAAAVEPCERALETARDLEDEEGELVAKAEDGLARALLASGRPGEATDHARTAVEAADADAVPLVACRVRATLGACHRERGDHDAAGEVLRGALSDAEDLGARTEACRIRLELGRLAAARGDFERARETLTGARDLARETGATLYERRCASALGDL